jgi:hypothetical protein
MRYIWTIAAVLVLSVFACNGTPSSPSGTAQLSVRLTDSPYSDAKAVLVTFSNISAHRSESDWTPVPFAGGATTRTCDLKKLEGADDVLGSVAVPVGKYTGVRVTVNAAALYFDNPSTGPACATTMTEPAGAKANLQVPSGEVLLNRPFDIVVAIPLTVLLDFHGDQSIHETTPGNYSMTPVITVVGVSVQ